MSDNFSTNMTISIGFSCLIIIVGLGFASLNNDSVKETEPYRPNPFLVLIDDMLGDFPEDIHNNPLHIFNYPIFFAVLGLVLFPPFVMYGGFYYTAWLPMKIYNKFKASQKFTGVMQK